MKAQDFIYFLILLFSIFEARAEDNPDKTLNFKGYVLSDSLEYNAESIDYFFDEHQIIFNKNANIKYLGRILKSPTINYYQDFEYMEAVGEKDSTGALINTPKFLDRSGEELDGNEIKYNLNSQEGVVIKGRTEYENGFMTAEKIKRVSDDTLFIAEGSYTTCDKEHPHYYFYGKKMKFILNDKLIIKPVIAYLHDIPVMWFPFYVFPVAKGRQSGFLTPRYGHSQLDGRYFSNIGYYFALSDYYDYRFATTLREHNGWLINNWLNYNKKYSIRGSIYGSFEDEARQGIRQWKISGSHWHTISPTLSLSGRANFQSSEFSRNNSPNINQRMNRNMTSSFQIRKRWKKSGNSLSANMSHTKNLDTDYRTTVAPNLSFVMPKKLIFGSGKTNNKQRKYSKKSTETDTDTDKKWYESVYYSLNANFKNTETERNTLRSLNETNFRTSLSSSQKFMGWLSANPSFSLNERFVASNDSISHKRSDNISARLSLNTKIYGTFKPSIGSLVGLRHVISPSISYSYGKRRDYSGVHADVFYRFDKNDNDKGRISRMSFSLRNLLQAKTVHGDKENKFDIFRLNFSSGVDFEKDERPISPLRTTLDIEPLKPVEVRLTASHDFYHDDDKFHLFSPYMNNMGITTTIGLSDKGLGSRRGTSSKVSANKNLGKDDFETDIDEDEKREDLSERSSTIPFKLRFTHNYHIRKSIKKAPGKYKYREIHTIKPTLSFSPSRNFSIKYYMYYDIKKKTLNSHSIIIKRDLHCWEANLSWVPSGIREGFYFIVNIKDLPDVKIEKRRGVSRFIG